MSLYHAFHSAHSFAVTHHIEERHIGKIELCVQKVYTTNMKKKTTKQTKLPKTTPEFKQAIKELASTPPISNKEPVKRKKNKS